MRLGEIIEAAGRTSGLPSFEEVVTPEMRTAFTQTFKRSHHGPEAFMTADSLETWIGDRLDTDLGVGDLLSHPEHSQIFERWLQARYQEVIRKLRSLFRKRVIRAHRIIKVNRQWFRIPRADLGIYWTYDLEGWNEETGGYAIWGGKRGTEVIIEALVPHASVDWVRTVRAHMDYHSGDREFELRLLRHSPIAVRSIKTVADGKALSVPKLQFTA